MRMIVVKGRKKTGKTTTCTQIIRELIRRGYTVGSAKDTHFEGVIMDHENTDSWKQAQAGASTVILTGPRGTNVMYQYRVELENLLDRYREDYVVTEGDPGIPAANIVTGRTIDDLEQRRDERTIGFSGVISGEMTEYDGMPVISGIDDIEKLVDLIEARSTEFSGTVSEGR